MATPTPPDPRRRDEGPSLRDLPKSPGKPIGATTIPKPNSVFANKPLPPPQAEAVAAWADQVGPVAHRDTQPGEGDPNHLREILVEIQLLRDDMNAHADKRLPASPRPVTAGMIAVGVFGGILVWTIFALMIFFFITSPSAR